VAALREMKEPLKNIEESDIPSLLDTIKLTATKMSIDLKNANKRMNHSNKKE
jgi:hypothetical protein